MHGPLVRWVCRDLPLVLRWGLLLGALPVFPGCAGEPEPLDDAAALDPSFLPARADYRMHCSVCHGKGGLGATNLFPPLRGSEWANGDPAIPIRAVLHGVEGPLTVRGEKYMNKMAPLGRVLSDQQIATILTYVRASWGNTGSPVSEDEVARVRAETAGRDEPWTEEEFQALVSRVP